MAISVSRRHRNTLHKVFSRRSSLLDRVSRAGLKFYLYRENFHFDPDYNGEHKLLQRLRKLDVDAETIFDIGANEGRWTAYAKTVWPNARFELFDPVPRLARQLRQRFGGDEQITVHNCAMGSADGSVEFHEDAEDASHSYVSEPGSSANVVPLLSGATVIERLQLERVDFCKIDTEGFDLNVIHGFEPQLAKGQMSYVQFEHFAGFSYGRTFASTAQFLRDYGYRVAKIFPEGLREVEYRSHSWSDLVGPNFVAASPDHRATFERLLTR